MSVLQKIGKGTEQTIAKALVCGALASGASYFLLKRQDAVSLFGMEYPEWVFDGVLLAAESATGDVIGSYAIPWAESKVVGSENLEKFLKWGAPPAIVATEHLMIKKYMVTGSEAQTGAEILLSAGSKMVADNLVNMYL